MATLTVAFECGCFKRSDYKARQTFDTPQAAKIKAEEMIEDMNENFCGRHSFALDARDSENLIITVMEQF